MSASPAHRAAQAAQAAALARGATRGEASAAFFAAREAAHGHPDADDRGWLVGQLFLAGYQRGVPHDATEAACGLPEGALEAGTASTSDLRDALARIRGGAS